MNRSAFLVASSTALALSSGVATAQSVPGGHELVERKANFPAAAFDALVGRPAQIRQVYETVSFKPGVLSSVKNSFNGLHFGFGYPAASIAVALAGHGSSAVYAYSDLSLAEVSYRRVSIAHRCDGRDLDVQRLPSA